MSVHLAAPSRVNKHHRDLPALRHRGPGHLLRPRRVQHRRLGRDVREAERAQRPAPPEPLLRAPPERPEEPARASRVPARPARHPLRRPPHRRDRGLLEGRRDRQGEGDRHARASASSTRRTRSSGRSPARRSATSPTWSSSPRSSRGRRSSASSARCGASWTPSARSRSSRRRASRPLRPGVSAALLTTISGLLVAIPCLFGYNLLFAMTKRLITELENYASSLADRLELESK